MILDQDSSNNFIELLNKTLNKKPTLIELSNQGHCLTNLNFYQIIKRIWIINMKNKIWNETVKNNFNNAAANYLLYSNIQRHFAEKIVSS